MPVDRQSDFSATVLHLGKIIAECDVPPIETSLAVTDAYLGSGGTH